MNTVIKINGLDVEMSQQVPKSHGAYWWAHRIGPQCTSLKLRYVFNPCSDVLIDRESDWQPQDVGGWWSTSPLVPAVEVEKAWMDGAEYGDLSRLAYERGGDFDPIQTAYANSRAKRVTEGGE